MQGIDSSAMRVYKSLSPQPRKAEVAELFELHVKLLKEGSLLLREAQAATLRDASLQQKLPLKVFLFNTCILLCRPTGGGSKAQLKVLIRVGADVKAEKQGSKKKEIKK